MKQAFQVNTRSERENSLPRSVRLTSATLSVYPEGVGKGPVFIPAGSVIVVKSNSVPLVDIEWENRALKMFAVDIAARGEELKILRAVA